MKGTETPTVTRIESVNIMERNMTVFDFYGDRRGGLVFVGTYGAGEFIVWNNGRKLAISGNAQSANAAGIGTANLSSTTLTSVKEARKVLRERGYNIYDNDQLAQLNIDELNKIKKLLFN